MAMNLTLVLYHLAADYHSGQWSRGYRLLCACQRRLKRSGLPLVYWGKQNFSLEEDGLYAQLATKYGEKL